MALSSCGEASQLNPPSILLLHTEFVCCMSTCPPVGRGSKQKKTKKKPKTISLLNSVGQWGSTQHSLPGGCAADGLRVLLLGCVLRWTVSG